MPKPPKRQEEPLCVLLDEGAPASIGEVFERHGYLVIHHRELLPEGASDSRVASAAQINKAILVAVDNDMKRISGRYGNVQERYRSLNLIKISCPEPMAASRVSQAMTFIELEWAFACEKVARRLYLDIGQHHLRTNR